MTDNYDQYDDTINYLVKFPEGSVERQAANEISTLRAMLYFAYGYISVAVPEWNDKHPEDISRHFSEMFADAYSKFEGMKDVHPDN